MRDTIMRRALVPFRTQCDVKASLRRCRGWLSHRSPFSSTSPLPEEEDEPSGDREKKEKKKKKESVKRRSPSARTTILQNLDVERHFNDVKSNHDLFLGLDINTKSSGYALLDAEGSILRWGRINTLKWRSDVVDVGFAIREQLLQIRSEHGDKQIKPSIEDFLSSFAVGRTNHKSLFSLAQLNGIISFQCADIFSQRASHYHPRAMRTFFNIDASTGHDIKQAVFDFAVHRAGESLPEIEIRSANGMEKRSSWEISRTGSFLATNFDVTDAYLIALYSVFVEKINALAGIPELADQYVESFKREKEGALRRRRTKLQKEGASAKKIASVEDSLINDKFLLDLRQWVAAKVASDSTSRESGITSSEQNQNERES